MLIEGEFIRRIGKINDIDVDSIFWMIVVEITIFIKALEKAKNQYFFRKLIRENIKWIILISFE